MSLLNKAQKLSSTESLLSQRVTELESKLHQEKIKSSKLTSDLRRIQEENISIAERLDTFLETTDKINAGKVNKLNKSTNKSKSTMILCANDWHSEENVSLELTNGINEFNLDIAKKRIDRLWNKTIYMLDFVSHIAKVDDLVLFLGGDHVSGAIHAELEESNFLGPTEAILWVQDRITEGIDFLLPYFKSITVVTSYGNHGRSTIKRRISTGYRHSWEWLAYNNISKYYRKESKLRFQISKGYLNWLNIQGRDVRFHHGDSIRFLGGIGGVHIPMRRKLAQWDKAKKADFSVCGHFHEYIDDYRYVISGCLVGMNAYGIEIGVEPQQPSQAIMLVDKSYGRCVTLPIFVEATK